MFKKILFSVSLAIFSFSSIAQDDNPSPHHFGVSAGLTTGFGISYRYWPSKFGLQITALPTVIQNNGSVTSFGASVLYMLKDKEKLDLYGYFGNSILYIKGSNNNNSNLTYNTGLGLGVKFKIFDELNINTQVGYGGLDLSNGSPIFSIVGEIGLYYHL